MLEHKTHITSVTLTLPYTYPTYTYPTYTYLYLPIPTYTYLYLPYTYLIPTLYLPYTYLYLPIPTYTYLIPTYCLNHCCIYSSSSEPMLQSCSRFGSLFSPTPRSSRSSRSCSCSYSCSRSRS